jgi:Cu2+-exporting ATPase
VQAVADRVVGWFVPLVVLVSAATAGIWLLRGAGAEAAMMNAVSVMVIACPCALGLATPLAILTGTSFGASRGILIKGGDVIERAKNVDTVVLDKTGTVTEGRPRLVSFQGIGITDEEALVLSASLERTSEHSLGRAIVRASGEVTLHPVSDFLAVPGSGVQGTINGKEARVGRRDFIGAGDVLIAGAEALEKEGATVVFLSYGGSLSGMFAVADATRTEAAEAVRMLADGGYRTVLLTGDGEVTAEAVAKRIGMGDWKARRTPVEKAGDIRELRAAGHRSAMVGDGINDAPALVEAEVGIAMGRATDIALESADIVLLGQDLRLVPLALRLSRKTFAVIRQNLFWAFFYNVVTLPLAVLGILHPIVAAGAMALSSLSVVGNSLRARVR